MPLECLIICIIRPTLKTIKYNNLKNTLGELKRVIRFRVTLEFQCDVPHPSTHTHTHTHTHTFKESP